MQRGRTSPKEKEFKKLKSIQRSVVLNAYIDELLSIVAQHEKKTKNEIIREILTRALENKVSYIKKKERQQKKEQGETSNEG